MLDGKNGEKCSKFMIYLIVFNTILILLTSRGIQALFVVKLLY